MKHDKKAISLLMAMVLMIGIVAMPQTDAAAKKKTIKVTDISFHNAGTGKLTLYKGQTYKLDTTVTPSNAAKKKVKYTLSKKNILSVNSKGKIKALKTGSVTLTAKSIDNSKIKAKIKIKVISKGKYKKIKSIKSKKQSLKLSVGESTIIKTSIKPSEASNKNLQYKSNNSKIAKVNNIGKVTALKKGTTTITIRALDGSKKKVTVKITVSDKSEEDKPKDEENTSVNEYIKLQIHQKDMTVTEIRPSLNGTFSTNGTLKSISYTIQDDSATEETEKSSGTAIIGSAAGIWEIPQIELSPGKNVITVIAETYSGLKAEKTVIFTYDRGSLNHTPQIEDIGGAMQNEDGSLDVSEYDEEVSKVPFVKNRLTLYFTEEISATRKAEILIAINATEIGYLNTIQMCQIELPLSYENIETLYAYAETLCQKYPEILSAEPEWVFIEQEDTIYNDDWNQAEWDTNSPADENWWAEAVNAPLAWDYADKMSPVRIGVVDDGFDTTHEDLRVLFSRDSRKGENSVERHGTHVAGIIGAKANNTVGITGLAWMNQIYGYDWHPTTEQNWITSAKIQDLYIEAIEGGCKVINLSLGTSGSLKDNKKQYWEPIIYSWGRSASTILGKLLEKGFDFVIVQSAGNGAKDGVGVDAVNNGHFASITELNCYTSKVVSKEDIMNRILIVGAAEQKAKGYQQTVFSNGGENVNITAPGKNIYSTLPGNSYGKLSGTSMAAPIVAATASLIWAVDSEFTGKEVCEIMLSKADKTASDHELSENAIGDIPMVNAGMAVEEAKNISQAKKIDPNAYRIVLKWEKNPEDLDAHLRAKNILGDDVHVYFNEYKHEEAYLDIDNTTSYGIETITIIKPEQLQEIHYAVHNYTDRDADSNSANATRLAESDALVKVYKGSQLLKIYQVPKNQKGTVWNVFSISEKGEILDINTMEYQFYSSGVLLSSH